MTVENIQQDLAAFITSRVALDGALAPDTDLLEAGIVDSLMIMELLAHVESTYNVRLEPGEIAPQNFRTVQKLGEFVARKKG